MISILRIPLLSLHWQRQNHPLTELACCRMADRNIAAVHTVDNVAVSLFFCFPCFSIFFFVCVRGALIIFHSLQSYLAQHRFFCVCYRPSHFLASKEIPLQNPKHFLSRLNVSFPFFFPSQRFRPLGASVLRCSHSQRDGTSRNTPQLQPRPLLRHHPKHRRR